MKLHRHWAGASLFAAVLFGAISISWAAEYTVTDLGTLGGTVSYAFGINNNGQVVGYAFTADNATAHAFLYSNGTMTDLGALGGTWSQASGINNSGQVVGGAYTDGAYRHAVLYSNGTMTDLGTLPGSTDSFAIGINDNGQVVGYASTAGDATAHAFLYSNGTMSDLGALGGTWSQALGINNNGQVVGVAYTAGDVTDHAFLYSNGTMSDLGTLGGTISIAYGINNNGQVVGYSLTAGNTFAHAFLYSNGTMSDLGTLDGVDSFAYGINNNGQVVGIADDAGGSHAFIYDNGVMKDLNSLVDPALGWILDSATAINDSGQIVGYGTINGQTHAFLMTPTNTTKPPVVIIPGIMGTELYHASSYTEPFTCTWPSKCAQVYPSTCTLGATSINEDDAYLFPLLLQSDGITPDTNSYCSGDKTICTTILDCPLTQTCVAGGAADIEPEGPLTVACLGKTYYNAYTQLSTFLHTTGGYTEGKDLFTYGYDWRLDLAGEATKLHNFLTDTSIFPDQSVQVDVIAHSMGGLLVRAYLAAFPNDNRIHSVIYLGTPQYGAPLAYAILEGTTSLIDKAGAPLSYQGTDYLNLQTETFLVQHFPGIYDLLPRFNFIKTSSGFESMQASFAPLSLSNNYLITNANNLYNTGLAGPDTVPRSFAINGTEHETLSGLDYTNPQCPKATVDLCGDGTVPTDGLCGDAKVPVDMYGPFLGASAEMYVDEIHQNLPSNPTVERQILNILNTPDGQEIPIAPGISSTPIAGNDAWNWKSCSPIRTRITDAVGNTDGLDSDGILHEQIPDSTQLRFTENEGGFMPFDQTYTVNIAATDNGLFTLEFDHLSSPNANVVASTIYPGIPISAQSRAWFTLSPTNTAPDLNLDVDGDGTADFTIPANTPPSPNVFSAVLISVIQKWKLPQGISTSLLAKLYAATSSLETGNQDAARGQLGAFLNEVSAQRGKKLSDKQADTLTRLATAEIQAL
ncbi:MAG: lipase/acyltransferase domain-containing protein [Acidiferrobacterales bacterium]